METLAVLEANTEYAEAEDEDKLILNEAYALVWNDNGKLQWLIGFAVEIINDTVNATKN